MKKKKYRKKYFLWKFEKHMSYYLWPFLYSHFTLTLEMTKYGQQFMFKQYFIM